MRAVVPLLVVASTAYAEPAAKPVVAFDKVRLDVVDGRAVARRGAAIARLTDQRVEWPPVVDAKHKTITLSVLDECTDAASPVTFTFDEVASRVENAAAYGLHVKKRYKDAAAEFAKALALDPKNRIAAVNFASAAQLLGNNDEAVKALAPWLASEPLAMYATIVADPELAPLLAAPAVHAIEAKVPGTVSVKPDALEGGMAYAPENKLLAVERTECSWGSDSSDQCLIHVEIFDASSGTLVAAIPLQEFDGEDHALAKRRAEVAQRTLRALGFNAEKAVVGRETTSDADRAADKRKVVLDGVKLGVVSVEGSINILRGNTVLAHVDTLQNLHGASWSPSAHALAIFSGRPGHEGCEGTDPQETVVVPLP